MITNKMSTPVTEPAQISAFLFTSSFFCCSVGGLRLLDMDKSPLFYICFKEYTLYIL